MVLFYENGLLDIRRLPLLSGLILDWDGTIVDTFCPRRASALLRLFCFRYLRFFYPYFEFLEFLFFRASRVHGGIETLIKEAREHDLLVGVLTDRSLFGLVASASACGFDLALLDFIDVRKSVFDRWTGKPKGTVVLFHRGGKDAEGSLEYGLCRWLRINKISHKEILFVGDDQRDARAAARCGFKHFPVDRHHPDFTPIYEFLKQE